MPKVVCFDVGGVLIRITQKWREAATYAGVTIREDFPADAWLWDAPFFDAYQIGELTDDAYLEQLALYLGNVTVEESRRVHNHIMIEPYPGVEQIVEALNNAGYITACLSNTNEPHWLDMFNSGRFPANEGLQIQLASHRMGLQKPDAEIFRKFEELSNASGNEIVFFDDSEPNIEAVRQFGWLATLINPREDTATQILAGLSQAGIQVTPASV